MRRAFLLGRLCIGRNGGLRPLRPSSPHHRFFSSTQWTRRYNRKSTWGCPPAVGTVILAAALSPTAFMKLAENNGGEKTGEMQMLEASHAETQEIALENLQSLSKSRQKLYMFFNRYIYEPIVTGARFLHLVIIFVPVLATVPVIWFGRRVKSRDNERTGTLWWYCFLVRSMERAGPAFIKVCYILISK
jgi:aarF domain-containing kinase